MALDPALYKELITTFEAELKDESQALVSELLLIEKKTNQHEDMASSIANLFRIAHNIKGAAKSVAIDAIAETSHQLEDTFSQWREKSHQPTSDEVTQCLEKVDLMAEQFKLFYSQYSHKEKKSNVSMNYIDDTVKVPTTRIENVNSKLTELLTIQYRIKHLIRAIDTYACANPNDDRKKLFDTLKGESKSILTEMTRSCSQLQDELQSLRLVPMSLLLEPLARTVRDLCRSLNKTVSLSTHGSDIEIDKPVLDALKDPLLHLVRNAIDHGIETDEERRSLGKPIPAVINVSVCQESGQIKIKLTDDGRGIDTERLKKIAVKKKLLSSSEANHLTEIEALDLIFVSGLSSQEGVSDISGRGVGMDAVKSNISNCKGSITVSSTVMQGTSFLLSVPISMATMRSVVVIQKAARYLFPTLSIERVVDILATKLTPIDGSCFYEFENELYPVVSLISILENEDFVIAPNGYYVGILVKDETRSVFILVDEVSDERETIILSLPKPVNKVKYLIGASLIDSGELSLVIDPSHLLAGLTYKKNIIRDTLKEASPPKPIHHKKERVLVVDDSITTRTLAISSLHATGFDAKSAHNGKQAWEMLQNEKFDCLVTDIEMPGMDGYELTQCIRQDKSMMQLPVIFVTSYDTPELREKSQCLGVSACLVKSHFNTNKLIQTIRDIL